MLRGHPARTLIRDRLDRRQARLSSHSLAETYSVLTRLPGADRAHPGDAARVLAATFDPPVVLPAEVAEHLADVLAPLAIIGGAVYDALVGLAAREAGLPLLTRDARALPTYAALDVDVELVAG
jgi:predicted nucleic acid-binding protein